MKKEEYKLVEANRLLSFLNIAYEDYISARILYNQFKLLQACFLANTAIEKLFKSVILISGVVQKKTHNLTDLYPLVVKVLPKLKEINFAHIEQLSKIYKCRYLSDLPLDYNIVIIRRKYLAELDKVFSLVDKSFEMKKNDEVIKTKYKSMVEDKDKSLFYDNHILLKINKDVFIEQLDLIYELRVMPNGELMELTYPTRESKNDEIFNFEGLCYDKSKESINYSLTVSHKIIENPIVNTDKGRMHMNKVKK